TWLIHRDTNHIRTIRTYAVDSLTGTRQLKLTEHFDRYGYRDDSTCHNEYDDQGRLTMTESYQWVSPTTCANPHRETIWRCSITYSPDGTVQHIKTENYTGEGTMEQHDMILLSRKEHPRFGLTECIYYLGAFDTIRFRREYDDAGHLLSTYCDIENLNGYHDTRYFYDASGRLVAQKNTYYESWDTLDYHYDSHGVLTSQTGHIYEIDMGAEVTVTFRPDGTRQESIARWTSYEDASELFYDYSHSRYDERGVLVYNKSPEGINEFEIEYWE
ncbi:MAG: hypothetical protein IJM74_04905, partial [Bacteroidales bacterium]|nr:hypothetical protein [Bacteroidales bacterium]